MTTKPHIPIAIIKPESHSRGCCSHDCDQGDTCPDHLQSTGDFGERELHSVLLVLTGFWAVVAVSMIIMGVMA